MESELGWVQEKCQRKSSKLGSNWVTVRIFQLLQLMTFQVPHYLELSIERLEPQCVNLGRRLLTQQQMVSPQNLYTNSIRPWISTIKGRGCVFSVISFHALLQCFPSPHLPLLSVSFTNLAKYSFIFLTFLLSEYFIVNPIFSLCSI